MISIIIDDLIKTQTLATIIASIVKKHDTLLLKGDLGSGKTTFTQYLIKSLSPEQHVQSPTFNIVNVYESSIGPIWHYDLYRIKNSSELNEIGLEESLSTALSIIEWPELAENIIHNDKIIIYFQYDANKNERKASIDLHGRFSTMQHYLEGKLKYDFR